MTDITLEKAKRVIELHAALKSVREKLKKIDGINKNPMVSITVTYDHGDDKIIHSGRVNFDDIAADVVRKLKNKYTLQHDELIREFHQLGAKVPEC
jgi:uncharacterized phage-like protein YoqJ